MICRDQRGQLRFSLVARRGPHQFHLQVLQIPDTLDEFGTTNLHTVRSMWTVEVSVNSSKILKHQIMSSRAGSGSEVQIDAIDLSRSVLMVGIPSGGMEMTSSIEFGAT